MAERRTRLLTLLLACLLLGSSWHLPTAGAAPVDSDRDGIYDAVEGTGDADSDGVPNYVDAQ